MFYIFAIIIEEIPAVVVEEVDDRKQGDDADAGDTHEPPVIAGTSSAGAGDLENVEEALGDDGVSNKKNLI